MMYEPESACQAGYSACSPVRTQQNEVSLQQCRHACLHAGMRIKKECTGALLFFLLASPLPSLAQSSVKIADEYSNLISARREIDALGSNLFGDRVDAYTGTLDFIQTDISIPGNNALEVSLGRHFEINRESSGYTGGMFAGWDLEIPHIHGIFSKSDGWLVNSSVKTNRCSQYNAPPDVLMLDGFGVFFPQEFWYGTFLYMPGAGDEEILGYKAGIRPQSGSYPLTTKSGMAIGCLPNLATASDGIGEGFRVVAPNGTTYDLNHMASRPYRYVNKRMDVPQEASITAAAGDSTSSPPGEYIRDPARPYNLERLEYWLMPTRATDRFGNTVTYTWDPSFPWRLTSITSSDGRAIGISYLDNEIRATSGGKLWSYVLNTWLSSLILPDGTSWQFNLSNFSWPGIISGAGCTSAGTSSISMLQGSMTHPSGVTGTFIVKPIVRGVSYSPPECLASGTDYEYTTEPAEFLIPAIQSKMFTGAGLPASGLTWSYTYGPANSCYAWANPFGMPVCTASSPTSITTTISDPSGIVSIYTFGNRYWVNQGQLLGVATGPANAAPSRATVMTYATTTDGLYPANAGYSLRKRGDGEMESRNLPLRQKTISQSGATYTWKVNAGCGGAPYCFDALARPTSVTTSSTPAP